MQGVIETLVASEGGVLVLVLGAIFTGLCARVGVERTSAALHGYLVRRGRG